MEYQIGMVMRRRSDGVEAVINSYNNIFDKFSMIVTIGNEFDNGLSFTTIRTGSTITRGTAGLKGNWVHIGNVPTTKRESHLPRWI